MYPVIMPLLPCCGASSKITSMDGHNRRPDGIDFTLRQNAKWMQATFSRPVWQSTRSVVSVGPRVCRNTGQFHD
jgi:hypothetical protein